MTHPLDRNVHAAAQLRRFTSFILARDDIRRNRLVGMPQPWTKDPILQKYRFCNVNREDDRVTLWIHNNIRGPHYGDQHLWFNLCVARLFNWPDTLKEIGYIKTLDQLLRVQKVCERIKAKGQKVFSAAYIVSTNGATMAKDQYVVENILEPLWSDRHNRPSNATTCKEWADWLMEHRGFAEFMANQVVTDMKYTHHLRDAPDRKDFVMAGPGTKRGLSRLCYGHPNAVLSNRDAPEVVWHLREHVQCCIRTLSLENYDHFCNVFKDLNNLSNCLCEWDKYERVRLGEGQPRATYIPMKDTP